MAKIELAPDLKEVVSKLKDLYPEAFSEIEPDRIVYIRSFSRGKRPVSVKAVDRELRLTSNYCFKLVVNSKSYDDLEPSKQHMLIFREILRIADFEEGKLEGYEIQDQKIIIEKYGVNWQDEDDLPDILAGG